MNRTRRHESRRLRTCSVCPRCFSSAVDEKRQSLVAYLRDHLGGADAAIHVVRRLAVEGRRRVLAAMTFPTLESNTHPRVV